MFLITHEKKLRTYVNLRKAFQVTMSKIFKKLKTKIKKVMKTGKKFK